MSFRNPKLLEFPQVYVVEASAGSGKTYALAKRYVSLLINPRLGSGAIPLENILAITFSNKAALEMKERIFELLKRLVLDAFATAAERDELLSVLDMEASSARSRAAAALDEIVRSYNYFQVQTIDSFINAILSGCAFKMNLSAAFKIKTDYREPLAYSLDELIDRAGRDRGILALFHHFLIQYLSVENKSGWFPKKDILSLITSLFARSNRSAGQFVPANGDAEKASFLRNKILRQIERIAEIAGPKTHASFRKSLDAFLAGPDERFDLDDLSDYFRRPEFPLTKGGAVPKRLAALWRRVRGDLEALAEIESGLLFNPYVRMLGLVLEDFRELASKEDVLFLEELNRLTRLLFDEHLVTVPELYYRLAARLRHFLIDEFQDTSDLQWRNLFLMVEEALATGGSLFYVGDKKQAIYRFRGGEVALFDDVKARFRSFNLIEESLQKNYRSSQEIVAFVNRLFGEANLRRFVAEAQGAKKKALVLNAEETGEVLAVFRAAQQSWVPGRKPGYVSVARLSVKTKEERDEAVKARLMPLIAELKTRFAYQDMALLTRHNDDVELLSAWLLEGGVPVASEKTLNVRNNALIKEIVSLLRFLNSPIDDLAFASFLLGDILAQASGVPQARYHDFIFLARQKSRQERGPYLYREFRRQFPQVWEKFLEEFFRNVGFVPLYELTIGILRRFEVLENFGAYQGFFMKFLELIKDREEDRSGLARFLEYFEDAPEEDLYVSVAASDAVHVLTVHKAKGLEFPVVALPFFEMNVRPDTDIVRPGADGLILQRAAEKYRSFSPQLEALYRREYVRAFSDEMNGLYVALTRPAEELYLFVPDRGNRGTNLAALLVPGDLNAMGEKSAGRAVVKPSPEAYFDVPVSRYEDGMRLLKEEFAPEVLLSRRRDVEAGEVLHLILSFIGDLKGKDEEEVLGLAFRKARPEFPWIEKWGRFERTVRRLVREKKLRPFFCLKEGSAYQEMEVVDAFGNTRRLDRLIVTEKEALVLDYKSAHEASPAHGEQVRGYMRLISAIYPSKRTRGFLVYLDDFSLEEVHE